MKKLFTALLSTIIFISGTIGLTPVDAHAKEKTALNLYNDYLIEQTEVIKKSNYYYDINCDGAVDVADAQFFLDDFVHYIAVRPVTTDP